MARRFTLEEFIKKAKEIHGDKYDYSDVIYKNSNVKVNFKCLKHNLNVYMTPGNHLSGRNCKVCAYESSKAKMSKTKEKFIEDGNRLHNNFYDYSLVYYDNAKVKVEIICPLHGNFWQTPDNHLRPSTCIKCKNERVAKLNSFTKEQFMEKANKLHNFKYDYSKANYKGDRVKLTIICPFHGDFEQCPGDHFKSQGCKKCGNIATSIFQKENCNGWSIKTWIKSAEKSKVFDSFKVYIIECYNENEKFYKVGRTFTTTNWRFRYKTQLPYKFNILKEIIGTAEDIFNLELNLKKQLKNNKYVPINKFDGMHECYYNIDTINYDRII